MAVAEIKKLLEGGKLVIGADRTIKNLRSGKTAKVFLANNPPADVAADIEHYAKLAGAEVVHLDMPNDELGVACKKPYAIAVLSTNK